MRGTCDSAGPAAGPTSPTTTPRRPVDVKASCADLAAVLAVPRGDRVALSVAPDAGVGLATDATAVWVEDDPVTVVGVVEEALRPRWVWWSIDTALVLAGAGRRVSTCWDIAAVHRLLVGGWRADPATVWADLHLLPRATIPTAAAPGTLDLFSQAGLDGDDPDDPVRGDGHLRPDWVGGGWSSEPARWRRWAQLALDVARRQDRALTRPVPGRDPHRAAETARSESAAELLCAELSVEGLPLDRATAEAIIATFVGPRPRDDAEAAAQRRQRDSRVLAHAPPGSTADLRSPAQVRALLAECGIDVPDTRSSRLEAWRSAHPLIDELLTWRRAERIASTYGYAWLDAHLGPDDRLRGRWSGSDGASGRMTATAGLHNTPAALRPAVVAADGMVFVRADLGQIEPRVLAAVSADTALAHATTDDDMYEPMARRLDVDRETAKVAMLAAMALLDRAERDARAGRDLCTYGGRTIGMHPTTDDRDDRAARARAAARGRYGRNALIQGAAAEFFKLWAVIVRARTTTLGARIVLCLHDELLVHAPAAAGPTVAALVADCLAEAAHRWAPRGDVRFVVDIKTVPRWSDAKA